MFRKSRLQFGNFRLRLRTARSSRGVTGSSCAALEASYLPAWERVSLLARSELDGHKQGAPFAPAGNR